MRAQAAKRFLPKWRESLLPFKPHRMNTIPRTIDILLQCSLHAENAVNLQGLEYVCHTVCKIRGTSATGASSGNRVVQDGTARGVGRRPRFRQQVNLVPAGEQSLHESLEIKFSTAYR